MHLSDEYLQRNKIKGLHKAKYCKEGYVLFKKKDHKSSIQNWKLLKILWTSQSRHPGAYDIELSKPIHDGYRYSAFFDSTLKQFFKWETYEENIFDIFKQMKDYEIVCDYKSVLLSFWNIFIFVFDSWFSDQSSEIQNLLFNTIDPELDVETRCRNLEKFLKLLENKHSWVYNHWYKNVFKCVDNYAFWANDLKLFHEKH